jgi:cytochrome c5
MDSALGLLGAEPQSKRDFLGQIDWLLDYLGNKPAPKYPFPIDAARAAHGKTVFAAQCAACHAGGRVGDVIPLAEIKTDAGRIGTWNEKAAREANKVVQDMGIERKGLVEAPLTGYVAQFLDGIWLRAPYLHNGSVPSLRDLLTPPAQRPREFWRGYDVYDPNQVGFVSQGEAPKRAGTPYDTGLRGNGNGGHDFGTTLPEADKAALIEYLKTL